MYTVIIVLAIVVLLVVFYIALYNGLTKRRILVQEAWSGIGSFLQQRNDLIPSLVETVKGYASHEKETLAEVIRLRNLAAPGGSHADQIAASQGLDKALANVFALAEQYPDLKANDNFKSLQSDLTSMETSINQARRYYNGTVRNYNQSIAVFPNSIIAGIHRFTPEPFFQESAGAEKVPTISFR